MVFAQHHHMVQALRRIEQSASPHVHSARVSAAQLYELSDMRFFHSRQTRNDASSNRLQLTQPAMGLRRLRPRLGFEQCAIITNVRRIDPVGLLRPKLVPTKSRMYPPPGRRYAAERQATAGQLGPSRHPSQVKLARFLAHVDAIAGPVLATVSGRVAAELIVGFSDGVSLTDGGHDLDNYLFPVAQRLGPDGGGCLRPQNPRAVVTCGGTRPAGHGRGHPQFSTREGEVGLRARFRCCRRPFPASPLPHPACPSQGTGRSTCLSRRVSRRWRRLLVSGSRGSGCCCRDSGSASR